MNNLPLAGTRIAVIVESQYIPGEIKIYQERFASYGATVDLLSRLWDAPSQRFYSTVEIDEDGHPTPLEFLDVSVSLEHADPATYAAVIIAANYTSVRLRWIGDVRITSENAAQLIRDTPASRFVRAAMANPRIIKAAPCHGLWMLTPSPEILTGRRVTCNQVLIADVINAGAIYTPVPEGTPPEQQIVIDRDLVTSTNWHASEALVDRIRDLILASASPSRAARQVPLGTQPVDAAKARAVAHGTAAHMASMTFVPDRIPAFEIPTAETSQIMAEGAYNFDRLNADVQARMGISGICPAAPGSRMLLIAAEHGVWASELTLAMRAFQAAGYDITVATLSGRAPMFLPASLDENFADPTWGAGWVAPGEAELGWQMQTELLAMERRGEILSLDNLIPARPQARDGRQALGAYEARLAEGLEQLAEVRGVVVTGGTGAIIDLGDNSQLEAILEMVHSAGKPVVTICYGTLAALYADDGAMMRGVSHTIHNRADDFVKGTAGLTDEGVARLRTYVEAGDRAGFISDGSVYTTFMRSPTTKAEVLAEAVGGPGNQVISPYTPSSCAVIDASRGVDGKGVIVTGRSIHCSYDAALAAIAHELGNERLPGTVLMMTGGEEARVPQPGDYNAAARA